MDAVSCTQARKNLTKLINKVCEDHEPVIITHSSESPVVMMSLEDYNAIEETLYLLRSPKNAQRLYKALADIKEGNYQKHDLIEHEFVCSEGFSPLNMKP